MKIADQVTERRLVQDMQHVAQLLLSQGAKLGP
jgi:hypothetical protein